jgi:hypothetical protein
LAAPAPNVVVLVETVEVFARFAALSLMKHTT